MSMRAIKLWLRCLLMVFVIPVFCADFTAHASRLAWEAAGDLIPAQSASARMAVHNGTPYVAYTQFGINEIVVRKHNGSEWVAVGAPLISSGSVSDLSIVIDHEGTPYVGYSDAGNNWNATVMKYDGTWQPVGAPGFTSNGALGLLIAVDQAGTLYAVYFENTQELAGKVMKYAGGGWVQVGEGLPGATSFSLAFDVAGTPYLAYRNSDFGNRGTVVKYDGNSWETVSTLPFFSDGWTSFISLAIDRDGMPVVAYRDAAAGDKVMVKKLAGHFWYQLGLSSEGLSVGAAEYISLAIDHGGVVYVGFADSGSFFPLKVMKYDGLIWDRASTQANLSSSTSVSDITLAIDGKAPYVSFVAGNEIHVMSGMDRTAPIAGNSGSITVTGATYDRVELAWAAAADNITSPASLQYRVYYSVYGDLGTVESISANGALAQDWTPNLTSATVSGLEADTAYTFNVLVRDEAGNVSAYSQVQAATTAALSYTIAVIGNQTAAPLIQGYASGEQETITIPIVNTGTGALVNLSVALSGPDADQFTLAPPPITIVNAGSATSFTIRAKDGLEAGAYTAAVTVSADHLSGAAFTISQTVSLPPAPGIPPYLAAEAGNGYVELSWSTVAGADRYSIYMSTESGMYEEEATASATDAMYRIDGLANGTTYYFVVKAVNAGGSSGSSNEAAATPLAPSSNAALQSLTIGEILLELDSPDAEYIVQVGHQVQSLSVHAAAVEPTAAVAINGSPASSATVNLLGGDNLIEVVVTAPDGETTKTYRIVVKRAVQHTVDPGDTEPIPLAEEPLFLVVPADGAGARILADPAVSGSGKEAFLPLVEAHAETSDGAIILTIPAGTRVTAPADWDGIIQLPKLEPNNSVTVINGTVKAVIEVGAGDVPLIFDRPVRLLLPGQGGQAAGFARNGEFHPITRTISEDTQAAADSEIPDGGDGALTVGDDLVIWTKHFTRFVAYEPVEPPDDDDSGENEAPGTGGDNPGSGDNHSEEGSGGSEAPEAPQTPEVPEAPGMPGQPGAPQLPEIPETPGIPSDPGQEDTDQGEQPPGEGVALTDIEGHWAADSIRELVKLGAVRGYADHSFKPDQNITRAEFVSVMVHAFGLEAKPGGEFADTASHWANAAISTAVAHGLVAGYNPHTFGPDDWITREQMAVIVIRAVGIKAEEQGGPFGDMADLSDWARPAVAAAAAEGLISGYPDGTFRPHTGATRAEAAAVIHRAMLWKGMP